MSESKQRKFVAREGWIEWLRILCMVWIILFHFCDYTSVKMAEMDLSPSWIALAFAKLGGGIGNCTFALISGYLLYHKEFKCSRIITLWLEVMFYSCFSFLIAVATQTYQWDSIPELVRNFIPITGIRYWYATVYFFIYLIHPLLNLVICQINRKTHIALIIIMLYFCSFIPTISGAQTMSSGGCVEIFILMYFIGALIHKYDLFHGPTRRYTFLLLACLLFMWISEIILKKANNAGFTYMVWPMRQLPVLMSAFLLFITFKSLRWKTGKIFQVCSKSTFGVYLIHIGMLQKLIYEKVFDIAWFYGKIYFAPMLFIYALLLFIICVLLDQLRIHYLEKPAILLIDKFLQRTGTKSK